MTAVVFVTVAPNALTNIVAELIAGIMQSGGNAKKKRREKKALKYDYIKQGDCLELMKEIPDKSVDMILCDLPYGTTKNKWDSVIPFEPLWEQYGRIVKESGVVVLFSQMPFTASLVMGNVEKFRYEWIWQKPNGTGFLNANKMPLKAHENILVFYSKLPTYNPQKTDGKPYKCKQGSGSASWNYNETYGGYLTTSDGKRFPKDIIEFKRETGLHPTQKPVALLEYLIKTYTNEGEVVLDNCMGSGSTCVAAINTKRHYIGFELDEKYFEIAEKRIEEAKQEGKANDKFR